MINNNINKLLQSFCEPITVTAVAHIYDTDQKTLKCKNIF